jgi:phosphatidylglycerophosphate synthase
MFDAPLRRATRPLVEGAGRRLHDAGIRPEWVTATGWVVGVGACVAAGWGRWPVALVLWLANRSLDGIDGAVARAGTPTERGGFLDIVADFSVYGGFLLGVAIAMPSARLACVALMLTYYTSGAAFLALSALLERRHHDGGDERSLRFVGGLAEGAETIAVYVLVCLLPAHAAVIAWAFAAAVAITAGQRVWIGAHALGAGVPGPVAPSNLARVDEG